MTFGKNTVESGDEFELVTPGAEKLLKNLAEGVVPAYSHASSMPRAFAKSPAAPQQPLQSSTQANKTLPLHLDAPKVDYQKAAKEQAEKIAQQAAQALAQQAQALAQEIVQFAGSYQESRQHFDTTKQALESAKKDKKVSREERRELRDKFDSAEDAFAQHEHAAVELLVKILTSPRAQAAPMPLAENKENVLAALFQTNGAVAPALNASAKPAAVTAPNAPTRVQMLQAFLKSGVTIGQENLEQLSSQAAIFGDFEVLPALLDQLAQSQKTTKEVLPQDLTEWLSESVLQPMVERLFSTPTSESEKEKRAPQLASSFASLIQMGLPMTETQLGAMAQYLKPEQIEALKAQAQQENELQKAQSKSTPRRGQPLDSTKNAARKRSRGESKNAAEKVLPKKRKIHGSESRRIKQSAKSLQKDR